MKKRLSLSPHVEWEVLRYTVARRLGISASVMSSSPHKEKIEDEMKGLWNPEFSYVIRQRAKEMSVYAAGSGLEHAYSGTTSSTFSSLFPDSKFDIFSSAENAWGRHSNEGKKGMPYEQGIAFMLAENPSTGWNYHGSHAENVFRPADAIGVGVYIDENGFVTAYTQFATKFPKAQISRGSSTLLLGDNPRK